MFPSSVIVYELEVEGWKTYADSLGYDVNVVREMPRYYISFIKRVPPPEPPWWETKIPPYDLVNPNSIIQFYDESGFFMFTKNVFWTMRVIGRNGMYLKVWDQPDPTRPDWFVKATDVTPV